MLSFWKLYPLSEVMTLMLRVITANTGHHVLLPIFLMRFRKIEKYFNLLSPWYFTVSFCV